MEPATVQITALASQDGRARDVIRQYAHLRARTAPYVLRRASAPVLKVGEVIHAIHQSARLPVVQMEHVVDLTTAPATLAGEAKHVTKLSAVIALTVFARVLKSASATKDGEVQLVIKPSATQNV